jgi:hypothetical protein
VVPFLASGIGSFWFWRPWNNAGLLRFDLTSVALRQYQLRDMAPHLINDYYVITSRRGEHPERWSWEIRRKSKPLGIKMAGDGYQSEQAAQFAGKRAPADFLLDLAREEKRK